MLAGYAQIMSITGIQRATARHGAELVWMGPSGEYAVASRRRAFSVGRAMAWRVLEHAGHRCLGGAA